MANRIQIRHGNGIPVTETFEASESNGLLPYELGWDTLNKALYINDNGTILSAGGNIVTAATSKVILRRKTGDASKLLIDFNQCDLNRINGNIYIYAYTCPRRKKTYYWRHPVSANNEVPTDPNNLNKHIGSKMGYGMLYNHGYYKSVKSTNPNKVNYLSIPDWMPDNGFLTTEFLLSQSDITNNYYELNIINWIKPLFKPNDFRNNILSWSKAGLIGVYSDRAPLLFKFVIVDSNGNIIFNSTDILAIGIRRGVNIDLSNGISTLTSRKIYFSIR